jgi:transposase InsO family protein
MNWSTIVGKITGGVDEHLLHRNDYLLAENRILRSRVEGRIRFTDPERLTLARAAKPLGRALLADIAGIVSPDTLLRWHRELVESKAVKTRADKRGRPPTDEAVVQLVLRFAGENPSWGYDRIAGALAELGHSICDSTVGNILKQHAIVPAPHRRKGKSWSDFVAAHKDVLVACDFFTKDVWTLTGLVSFNVLFFIHIASRKVFIAGFTANPNELWMEQIARKLIAPGGFLAGMKHLILDRDGKFAPSFRKLIESAGIEVTRLPPRSPNLNAFAERFVRSIKEECLDQLILFGEVSLQRALDNFIDHYHHERPHQGKENIILLRIDPTVTDANPPRAGPVQCKKRLGGLLKFYHRDAA